MSVEKLATKSSTTQSTKPKGQGEASPSKKKKNPIDNTRKAAVHTQASRSSVVTKRTRRTTIVPRMDIQ
jgi:hypothetical protein